MSQSQSSPMDHPLSGTATPSSKAKPLPSRRASNDPLLSPIPIPNQHNNQIPKSSTHSASSLRKQSLVRPNNTNNSPDLHIPLILPLKINADTNKWKKGDSTSSSSTSSTSSAIHISSPTTTQTAPKPKVKSIFDSSLNSHRNKRVSLSAFSHLFCALVQYSQVGVKDVSELEDRLSNIGHSVGLKQLELMTYRANNGRRHRDVIGMLEFIKDVVWKHLFGRTADGLEQSTSNKNEFFIIDHNPVTNRYVSVPDHLGDFNAASFIGGIIHGVLDGAGFPCTIIAHQQMPSKTQPKKRTVFIVRITPKKKHSAWIQ